MDPTIVVLPEPFASIPRSTLTLGPSPIQPLPRISEALGGKVKVYAKREDLNSGLAFGGNKVRKLEYLVPDALARGCDTLVSIGGVQSNHTRAVAAVAAATGLRAATVQEHWVDWPDPAYHQVGNLQLSRLMGANVHLDPAAPFGIEHKSTLAALEARLRRQGQSPYYIPAGASDHPLGGLGFARWAFEVAQQEDQDQDHDHDHEGEDSEKERRSRGRNRSTVFFDTVLVCVVTGSTLAGMIAGFKLLEKKMGGRPRRVIGIDASAKVEQTFEQVLRIAKSTAARIGLSEQDITEADVELVDRYHAGIYGIPDEQTIEAIKFGARTEAFITDPVYEGKSLAGMMDMIKTGEIPEGSNVLYAHLGGQVALNAYSTIIP